MTRSELAARNPLFQQDGLAFRTGRLQSLFLLAIAATFCGAYLSIGYLPGNSPYPLGWWGWWDQSQYLKSAEAFGKWDLDPAQHWYPLTYSLLAAPFIRYLPYHAFFFVNLLSFLALAWLMMQLGRQLGVGAIGGAIAFLVGAVLPKILLAQYVIPWTTTPVAALYVAVFVAYVGAIRDGFTSGRVAVMTTGVLLVAAFRPVDAAPLLPIAVHVAWRTLRPDSAAAPVIRRLLTPAAAGGAVLVAYLALHYAIYGAKLSPYMRHSAGFGLDPAIIPFRFAVIFGNPTPFFGEGTGLLQRYPLVSIGLWALVYVTFWQRTLLGIAAAVWISFLLYLAYPDFLPSGIWRYMNIHYWKWLFPIMALLTFVAARDVWQKRSRAAALLSLALTAPLILVSLKAAPSSARVVQIADGNRVALTAERAAPIAAIKLQGVSGGYAEVYWGEHQLLLDDRTLRHIADFRMMPVGDAIFVVPNRPVVSSEATLVLDKRLAISPQLQLTLLQPVLGLRNPFVRRMSEADWRIPWRAVPKADHKCRGEVAQNELFPSLQGEFIHATYAALLGRPPDTENFDRICEALVSGRMKRNQLIEEILEGPDYKTRLK
jgi:hypothetical protein